MVIRNFVENYHEKLEEQFIFPLFEKRKEMVDLVSELRRQHEAGRRITDAVLQNATAEQIRKADARQQVIRSCEAFIRMYRPHEAREDTVLFLHCTKSWVVKKSKNWVNGSRRKSIAFSERVVSTRLWRKSLPSRRNWASMN